MSIAVNSPIFGASFAVTTSKNPLLPALRRILAQLSKDRADFVGLNGVNVGGAKTYTTTSVVHDTDELGGVRTITNTINAGVTTVTDQANLLSSMEASMRSPDPSNLAGLWEQR